MWDYGYISQRPAYPAAPAGPISVEEQLRVLAEKHGIHPNFPDFVDYLCREFGREYVEANPYNVILTALGGKRKILDEWQPCSDRLLLIDTEDFECAERYEELLADLSRIAKGGFPLQNLQINWYVKHKKVKNGVGISYEIWGKQEQHMIYKSDGWFYPWLISHLNNVIYSAKHPGRFFLSAPDQTILLYFGSDEQVKMLNHLTSLFPFQRNVWGAVVMPW
ncbi:MAG: hypothetical protein IJE29_06545 [Firmicutes bacterium]|nr:hypothetical protein [Bacillota bacterium]